MAVRPTLADFVLRCPAAPRSSIPRTSGRSCAGRHLPGRPGPRGRRGLGRAVDDAAAGRRRRRRLRAAGGLRRRRPRRNVGVVPRARRRAATGSRCATSTTASTRRGPRPGRARPARAVAGGQARRGGPAPGRASSSPTCPSIVQVAQLREALDDSGFELAETIEVLQRTWHVEGQAVRPDHRMVAHTGFLTSARLLGRRR